MNATASLRPLELSDLDLVVHQREAMFRDMGILEATLETMRIPFRNWLAPKLADGTYLGWIADLNGIPAGGIGMVVLDWPPHPWHPSESRRGYILNVYVNPSQRGHGLASQLTLKTQEYAQEQGIGFITLHASPAGRPVYEKLGWKPTSEMSLRLGG